MIDRIAPSLIITTESVSDVNGTYDPNKTILFEDGSVQIHAIFQDEKINRNRKHYDGDEILKPAIQAPRIVDLVNRGMLHVEFGHPILQFYGDKDDPAYKEAVFKRLTAIDFKETCGSILSLEWDDIERVVRGDFRTGGPYGKDAAQWIRHGKRIAFSARSATPYQIQVDKPFPHIKVQRGISLVTYDLVAYPSHASALQISELSEAARIKVVSNENFNGYGVGALALENTNADIIKHLAQESDVVRVMMEEVGCTVSPNGIISLSEESYLDTNVTYMNCTLNTGDLAKIKVENKYLGDIADAIGTKLK